MRRLPLMLLLLLMIVLLPCASAMAAESVLLINPQQDELPAIPVYAGPSAYTKPLAYCYAGTSGTVLDQGSGYVRLQISTLDGWVPQEYIAPQDAAAPVLPVGLVNTSGVQRYQSMTDKPGGTVLAALAEHLPVEVLAVYADDTALLVRLHDGTLGCLPAEAVSMAENMQYAWVYASEPSRRLHLRTAPSTKGTSLGVYYSGVKVQRIFTCQAADDWMRVVIEGVGGWMKTEFLSFHGSPGEWLPPVGIVQGTADSGLNLRDGADYAANVLTRYTPGTPAEIMGVTSEWAHVRLADGATGYMLLRHLGSDPPAAVPNRMPLATACTMLTGNTSVALPEGTLVQLTDSRPSLAWRSTADGMLLSLAPDSWVICLDSGAMGSIPTAAISAWQ